MMQHDPDYIVSQAGGVALSAMAQDYNTRRERLDEAKADIERAREWNKSRSVRLQEHPPLAIETLLDKVVMLRIQLTQERAEICRLSGWTVKP